MKNLFTLIGLIVSLTLSAGQYLLPIGSNVNNHTAQVGLALGGYGVRLEESFSYEPAMGELETLIRNRLWKLAEGFAPRIGFEDQSDYYIYVVVEPGPYAVIRFPLSKTGNRWVVPTEALNVELKYSNVAVQVTWVTGVEMEVRNSERTELFSTILGTGGTVCRIANTLGGTYVSLSKEYTVPKYRETWWTEGEVTLWAGEQWARFNILDGGLMETSPEPPTFLSQLVAPSKAPRITSLRWVEGTAIITVAVADGTPIILEFSENFRKWVTVGPPTVSKMSAGSRTLTHTPPPEAQRGFYRILVPPPPAALKGTP